LKSGESDTLLLTLAEPNYCQVDVTMSVINVYATMRSEKASIAVVTDDTLGANIADAALGVMSWYDISKAANLPNNMKPVSQ